MPSSRYALVAYVKDPVAEFIKKIRQELHPDLPHLAAHVTVLPPCRLLEGEDAAVSAVSEVCREVEPFEMRLGEVETFIPVTPTVFIRVVHAYRLRQEAYRLAQHRWKEQDGGRCIQVKELTFVRELEDSTWVDVAVVALHGVASEDGR